MSSFGAHPAAGTRAPSPASSLLVRPRPAPAGGKDRLQRTAALIDRAALALLLLSIGTLIFRPADLFQTLANTTIYQMLLLACIACSAPRLIEKVSVVSCRWNAVFSLACLLPASVVLSHLWNGDLYHARTGGLEMLKGLVLFILIVALVDTPERLRIVLLSLTAAVLAITATAVLQYHGVIQTGAAMAVLQSTPASTLGAPLLRLCAIGIFNDPNDFAMLLFIAACGCGYAFAEFRSPPLRLCLLAMIILVAYAMYLTQSRTGLLSAAAGVLVLIGVRFGFRNAALVLLLLVSLIPWLLSARGGLNLTDPQDTFQSRLELWNWCLDAFRSSPLLGIGEGKLVDAFGSVAHNSYLHAFAELGLLGGIAFTGLVAILLAGLAAKPSDPETAGLRPWFLAILAASACGLLALSRCYAVSTHLVLGMSAASVAIAAARDSRRMPPLDLRLSARLLGLGMLVLSAVYITTRVLGPGPA